MGHHLGSIGIIIAIHREVKLPAIHHKSPKLHGIIRCGVHGKHFAFAGIGKGLEDRGSSQRTDLCTVDDRRDCHFGHLLLLIVPDEE